MIDFILKNKEWLFSGLGIALVVLIYNLVRMAAAKMKERGRIEAPNVNLFPIKKEKINPQPEPVKRTGPKRKRPKNKSLPRSDRNSQREKVSDSGSSDSPSQFRNQSAEPQPANTLTPQRLIKLIDTAPLLQQSQIAEYYKGQVISCQGTIHSAYKGVGNDTNLILVCGQVGVSFNVNQQHHPSSTFLKKGDRVLVTGRITNITSPSIFLETISVTKMA